MKYYSIFITFCSYFISYSFANERVACQCRSIKIKTSYDRYGISGTYSSNGNNKWSRVGARGKKETLQLRGQNWEVNGPQATGWFKLKCPDENILKKIKVGWNVKSPSITAYIACDYKEVQSSCQCATLEIKTPYDKYGISGTYQFKGNNIWTRTGPKGEIERLKLQGKSWEVNGSRATGWFILQCPKNPSPSAVMIGWNIKSKPIKAKVLCHKKFHSCNCGRIILLRYNSKKKIESYHEFIKTSENKWALRGSPRQMLKLYQNGFSYEINKDKFASKLKKCPEEGYLYLMFDKSNSGNLFSGFYATCLES